MPEDGPAADVASASPRDAQNARDRSGRACLAGAERVAARRACAWRCTVWDVLVALAGAETGGLEVTVGVDTRVEVGGALTVVEVAIDPRAAGAGSGRIEG